MNCTRSYQHSYPNIFPCDCSLTLTSGSSMGHLALCECTNQVVVSRSYDNTTWPWTESSQSRPVRLQQWEKSVANMTGAWVSEQSTNIIDHDIVVSSKDELVNKGLILPRLSYCRHVSGRHHHRPTNSARHIYAKYWYFFYCYFINIRLKCECDQFFWQ